MKVIKDVLDGLVTVLMDCLLSQESRPGTSSSRHIEKAHAAVRLSTK
jgi:hypothetical protein